MYSYHLAKSFEKTVVRKTGRRWNTFKAQVCYHQEWMLSDCRLKLRHRPVTAGVLIDGGDIEIAPETCVGVTPPVQGKVPGWQGVPTLRYLPPGGGAYRWRLLVSPRSSSLVGGGHMGQILDHLLGVLRFPCSRLASGRHNHRRGHARTRTHTHIHTHNTHTYTCWQSNTIFFLQKSGILKRGK